MRKILLRQKKDKNVEYIFAQKGVLIVQEWNGEVLFKQVSARGGTYLDLVHCYNPLLSLIAETKSSD